MATPVLQWWQGLSNGRASPIPGCLDSDDEQFPRRSSWPHPAPRLGVPRVPTPTPPRPQQNPTQHFPSSVHQQEHHQPVAFCTHITHPSPQKLKEDITSDNHPAASQQEMFTFDS